MIVGKDIKNKYPKNLFEPGEEILRFEHVSVENKLNDISFNLRKGEVLGIVGLMGAGKTEIAKLIFGALVNDKKVIQGKIHIFGEERVFGSPIEAVKNGIGLISENRADEGLLLIHDIKMNISTPALRILSKNGFVKEKEEKNVVQDLITRLQIKCGSYSQLVRSLSGGNQQKVVIAKWFASRAKLVLFDEPTRGIDVGAKVDVYNLMNELVNNGVGVILLSSEVPEVYGMADRILVLKDGQVVQMLNHGDITEAELQQMVM